MALTNQFFTTEWDGNGLATAGMVNPGNGGLESAIPFIGTDGNPQWVSAAVEKRASVIPFVLSVPGFFKYLPNQALVTKAFIDIFTTHITTIEGLDSGLRVELEESPIGRSDQTLQEPTAVKENRSSITFGFDEKLGRTIQKFLTFLIEFGIQYEKIGYPRATDLPKFGAEYKGRLTPDFYSWTMAFIEPDTSFRYANEAYIATNMFPTTNGDRTSKRDIRSPMEMIRYSIPMTSITDSSQSTLRAMNELMAKMAKTRVNPNLIPAYSAGPNDSIGTHMGHFGHKF